MKFLAYHVFQKKISNKSLKTIELTESDKET